MDLTGVYDGDRRLCMVCSCVEVAERMRHGVGAGSAVSAIFDTARVKVRGQDGAQRIMTSGALINWAAELGQVGIALAALNCALETKIERGDGWGPWFRAGGQLWQIRVLQRVACQL